MDLSKSVFLNLGGVSEAFVLIGGGLTIGYSTTLKFLAPNSRYTHQYRFIISLFKKDVLLFYLMNLDCCVDCITPPYGGPATLWTSPRFLSADC